MLFFALNIDFTYRFHHRLEFPYIPFTFLTDLGYPSEEETDSGNREVVGLRGYERGFRTKQVYCQLCLGEEDVGKALQKSPDHEEDAC